ncbi:hypothetical protein [Pseudoalteromonas ruthenica]|uniref:hypothetical protein n=1 Tax=Pseudoalteromonas ruthenica TaxID=151081 RepID=UPI001478A46E|nr:hypothetical protein [Pseudoalteromonas ruthenica]
MTAYELGYSFAYATVIFTVLILAFCAVTFGLFSGKAIAAAALVVAAFFLLRRLSKKG